LIAEKRINRCHLRDTIIIVYKCLGPLNSMWNYWLVECRRQLGIIIIIIMYVYLLLYYGLDSLNLNQYIVLCILLWRSACVCPCCNTTSTFIDFQKVSRSYSPSSSSILIIIITCPIIMVIIVQQFFFYFRPKDVLLLNKYFQPFMRTYVPNIYNVVVYRLFTLCMYNNTLQQIWFCFSVFYELFVFLPNNL